MGTSVERSATSTRWPANQCHRAFVFSKRLHLPKLRNGEEALCTRHHRKHATQLAWKYNSRTLTQTSGRISAYPVIGGIVHRGYDKADEITRSHGESRVLDRPKDSLCLFVRLAGEART